MEEKECPKHYITVRYNECDPTAFAFNGCPTRFASNSRPVNTVLLPTSYLPPPPG
jgi:hypothetical protein